METVILSLGFGLVIGLALGLTGGGGSIFAVPLLVYAMSVPPHEAVGISLAAVGTTAAWGVIQHPCELSQLSSALEQSLVDHAAQQ